MKKAPRAKRESEPMDEYDFSQGVRGQYAERFAAGSNVVVLSPEVAEVFPDSKSVNESLRPLAKLIRERSQRAPI